MVWKEKVDKIHSVDGDFTLWIFLGTVVVPKLNIIGLKGLGLAWYLISHRRWPLATETGGVSISDSAGWSNLASLVGWCLTSVQIIDEESTICTEGFSADVPVPTVDVLLAAPLPGTLSRPGPSPSFRDEWSVDIKAFIQATPLIGAYLLLQKPAITNSSPFYWHFSIGYYIHPLA